MSSDAWNELSFKKLNIMAGRIRKVYVNTHHKYGITFGEDSYGNICFSWTEKVYRCLGMFNTNFL